MISLLGSELKTYPLNYMTAVIDTIADNNDVNILLIIFQSKSMMLKLFWQLQALNRTKYILIYLGDLRGLLVY
jgi:heptosyltransferase-2